MLQGRDWPNFFSGRGTCLNFLGWKSFLAGRWSHLGAKISHFSSASFQHIDLAMSARGSVSEVWPGWPSSSPWQCIFPHRPGAQSQMAESTCKEPRKMIRQLAREVKARVMHICLIHPENTVSQNARFRRLGHTAPSRRGMTVTQISLFLPPVWFTLCDTDTTSNNPLFCFSCRYSTSSVGRPWLYCCSASHRGKDCFCARAYNMMTRTSLGKGVDSLYISARI